MNYLLIAAGVLIFALGNLFGFALCRAAARGDQLIEASNRK